VLGRLGDQLGGLAGAMLLARTLPGLFDLLEPGGVMVVIAYHSGEDRIVKHIFNEATAGGYDAIYRQLTKKPIQPTRTEIVNNPRSRSAKLRGVAKINTERTD